MAAFWCNQAELNRDRWRVFVIIRVKGNADQVSSTCQQEHQSQYRTAKTLVENLAHKVVKRARKNTQFPTVDIIDSAD